jgi:hypothetical protein
LENSKRYFLAPDELVSALTSLLQDGNIVFLHKTSLILLQINLTFSKQGIGIGDFLGYWISGT